MTVRGQRAARVRAGAAKEVSRRSILSAGLLGAVAVAGAACGTNSNAAINGPSTAPRRDSLPHGDDIVVGACLELTGVGSAAGIAAQHGLNIALDKLNTVGVVVKNEIRNVRLVVRDNASNPQAAADLTQQLIAQDKVCAVIGGATAGTSVAMAVVAEKAHTPLISTAAADSIILPVTQRRFVFKLASNAADVAAIIVDDLNRRNAQRVALLVENTAHGSAGFDAMTTAIGAPGRLVLAETLPVGAGASYAAQAARVVQKNADAVVIWSVAPISTGMALALHAARFTGVRYFDSGAASGETLEPASRLAMAGSYLVGPSIVGGAPREITTPASGNRKDYVDDYARRYGTISGLSVYGADALNLVTAAASRYGSVTPLKIRNALESFPYSGLAGTYSFTTIKHGGVDPDLLTLFKLGSAGWSAA